MATGHLLEARGLSKRFGANLVLDDVSIELAANSIVGIVGENGAGKSTLFNILCAVVRPDAGEIRLHGRPFAPRNLAEANRHGVSRVFQEQALIPNATVYENLLLGHEERFSRGGILDQAAMIDVAERILLRAKVAVDVRAVVGELDFSKRQLVEIARACLTPQEVLGIGAGVVLLDEPTASLQKEEERAFFDMVASLREHASVLFVSHRLSEVLAVSDRVYVLKDGRLVADLPTAETSERRLHALMVGRERDADYYHEGRQRTVDRGSPAFAAEGLSRRGHFSDVSFTVRQGEILGIGGLLLSGKEMLGKVLAGVVPSHAGRVRLGDLEGPPEVQRLIAAGLGYVPAERQLEGMIQDFPVAWNISLASGRDLVAGRFGTWRGTREQALAAHYIDALQIRGARPGTPCRTLSGGNQQKVVLARWLCRDLKVLILDNPTRGVDAGAKEEIYGFLRALTERGVAIVLITDELLELIGLSNRIAIMHRGRIAATIEAPAAAKPGERQLIELMLKDQAPPPTAFVAAAAPEAAL
jgi:ribose transport system ATP-binding protein